MIANVQHWTELIGKKLSGNIREDEARILDAWIARDPEHREYFETVSRTWEMTGQTSGAVPLPKMDWSEIEAGIPDGGRTVSLPKLKKPDTVVIRRIGLRAAGVAAVFLLGFMLVYQLTQKEPVRPLIVAEALQSSVEQITLPDGSEVTLRQGSRLTYHPDFSERALTLEGEAFFKVAHDPERPFTVSAGEGSIRVLGTQFNVIANPGMPVELFVTQGQVAFAPAESYDAKIFSQGQAGVLENQQVVRTAPPGPNVSSWISGHLVFDHETLNHVIRDISRHFDVEISVADSALYACEFKADFDHATLDDVLETLSFGLNLQIDQVDSTYLISGEPCSIKDKN